MASKDVGDDGITHLDMGNDAGPMVAVSPATSLARFQF